MEQKEALKYTNKNFGTSKIVGTKFVIQRVVTGYDSTGNYTYIYNVWNGYYVAKGLKTEKEALSLIK